MTEVIEHFSEISDDYDALFCDLWGCVHNGIRPFPGAVSALRRYRENGGRVILLTNAPRPRSAVRNMLSRIGLPDECWDDIVTSGDAAQAGLVAGMIGRPPLSKPLQPFDLQMSEIGKRPFTMTFRTMST